MASSMIDRKPPFGEHGRHEKSHHNLSVTDTFGRTGASIIGSFHRVLSRLSAELDTGLGARPPGAPQVQRNGRGPAQREQGLLLRARWLADAAQTPRGVPARQDHRHVGHRQRPTGAVPHEVSFTGSCGQVEL